MAKITQTEIQNNRKPGFYWVKRKPYSKVVDPKWEVGKWNGERWNLFSCYNYLKDEGKLEFINESPIENSHQMYHKPE